MKSVANVASGMLALALLGVLAALSVRGILDPGSAAASFGIGVEAPEAALYQAVYRSRNLVLALTGLVFLLLRYWKQLAVLSTLAIALPLFDMWVLSAAGRVITPVHPATFVALLVLSATLWLRVRIEPRGGQ